MEVVEMIYNSQTKQSEYVTRELSEEEIAEIENNKQEIVKQKRIAKIQSRLDKLSQDIVQDMAGEVVPDIEERKAEFIELHNELRVLLGKEERELKEE